MKIIGFVIIAGIALLLSGCNRQQASIELYNSLENANVPLAKSWVTENVNEAVDVNGTVSTQPYRVYAEIVEGTYKKDNKKYNFCFNVNTNKFYTDEYFEAFSKGLEEKICGELPDDLDYNSISITYPNEKMDANFASDQEMFGKRDTILYTNTEYDCLGMTPVYEADMLDEYINKYLNDVAIDISIETADIPGAMEIVKRFLAENSHDNWNFIYRGKEMA